jgi:hypothetical protein
MDHQRLDIKPPNRAAFFCARWAAQVSRLKQTECFSAAQPNYGRAPALNSLLYFSCGTDFAAVRNRIGSEG